MIKLITAEMVFRSYFACRKWSVPPAAKKKRKKKETTPDVSCRRVLSQYS